jgi:hypothetical protein
MGYVRQLEAGCLMKGEIGRSLGDVAIPILKITNPDQTTKRIIVIIGR